MITDAAINIFPDLEAKRDIVQNAIERRLHVRAGWRAQRREYLGLHGPCAGSPIRAGRYAFKEIGHWSRKEIRCIVRTPVAPCTGTRSVDFGTKRPQFEDKVAQRAIVMVLEAVYEQDFLAKIHLFLDALPLGKRGHPLCGLSERR